MSRRDPLANPEPLIRSVYAYVAYRIGDGPDAEDITSDVFERALRYHDSFDAEKGQSISWLIGIARRCVASAALRRPELATPQSEQATGSDLESETIRRLTVAGALERLPQDERELIALRYGADLTAVQIGEVLGMRANTVEVKLHRTLGKLRAAVEQAQSEPPPARGIRSVRV